MVSIHRFDQFTAGHFGASDFLSAEFADSD